MHVPTRIAVFLGAGWLLLSGCHRAEPQPNKALRDFLAQIGARRAEAVWSGLSTRSQAELKRRAEAIGNAAGTDAPNIEAMLFDHFGLAVLNKPETIAVVSPIGPEVTLRVTVKNGKSADVRMVREGEHWKVDLFETLKPIGQSQAVP